MLFYSMFPWCLVVPIAVCFALPNDNGVGIFRTGFSDGILQPDAVDVWHRVRVRHRRGVPENECRTKVCDALCCCLSTRARVAAPYLSIEKTALLLQCANVNVQKCVCVCVCFFT